MGNIRLLPDIVASQVAAGEVVERPASVLKELVENSLDAQAGRIEIEVVRGGTALIRVADNGRGMDRDDALLCLERHATSKIRSGADLQEVRTFGFRGEALPSIASVSRLRLATRTSDSGAATEILVEGGRVREVRECGDPPGTSVEVRSLFFNIPARKKFLRTELTENAHLLHGFQAVALAHPGVEFLFIKDGKSAHRLPVAASLRVRVLDLLGEEWCDNLVETGPWEGNGIRIRGLVSRPAFRRTDRSGQFVFLNRRPVQDAAVARGLREAFDGLGERGGHPVGVVFIEMDPRNFDCNVHPAKREVRFFRPDVVREAVYEFARAALRADSKAGPVAVAAPLPSAAARAEMPPPESVPPPASARPPVAVAPKPVPATRPLDLPAPRVPAQPEPAPTIPDAAEFLFRGPLGDRYLLFESRDGLVLVDRRHAAERIFYEDAIKSKQGRAVPGQQLLSPAVVQLPPKDHAWVVEHLLEFARAGMHLESFGPAAVKIDSVPAGLDNWTPQELLFRLLDEVRGGTRASAERFWRDQVALALARIHAARLRGIEEDPAALVRRLMACDLPYASPSGHPTLLQLSWNEISRKFGV